MTEISFFSFSPYLVLLLAVFASLLGRKAQVVFALLPVALLLGFVNQQFNLWGLLILILTPITFFIWEHHHFADSLRKLCLWVFLICSVILGLHYLPGLSNLKIFEQVVLTNNAPPFDMFLNFDKCYLALVIINILQPLDRMMPFKASLLKVSKYYLITSLLVFPLAWSLGVLSFQINSNPYILIWALNNFLLVCFFEEIVFRRFLQTQMVSLFRNVQYGDLLAIFMVAVLFGLAHFSGGWVYVGFATLAGLIYGLCFYQVGNYRSTMLLHFAVNLTHVLFFTYPYAAS